MSQPHTSTPATEEALVAVDYVLDVRIVERETAEDESPHYRFEAPDHTDITFEDLELAQLYADVYFDVNGFAEAGTGDCGVPPEIVQAGKDTLAAYLVTQPGADIHWVASFYGVTPDKIERYCSWVRQRATEIRTKVDAHEE